MRQTDFQDQPAIDAVRITGESMLHYLPGAAQTLASVPLSRDVVMLRFSHRSINEPILVPAVVEPLLVWVLSGAARVEERDLGGKWQLSSIKAGDFFLTNSGEPYEMRWQAQDGAAFEVMHLYLGLPLIEQAARDVLGERADPVTFVDISGAQDEQISVMLEQLRHELLDEHQPSPLFTHSLAQALAVHLVRRYRDPHRSALRSNALPAYKLRRVIEAMNERLAEDFSLTKMARVAELSEYHFSRMFKRATGLAPSQYFIRLRMSRARHLLLETDRSIIDIGLEVGYSSPSHFSQVFRREVGVAPSNYRQA